MGLRFPGTIAGAKAQIGVERVCIDNLAGIHLPVRIPNALEFPERAHDLLAKHDGQQFAARLAISMFSGERAAIVGHEFGRLLDERSVVRDPLLAGQVEGDAAMDAALAEMSIKRAIESMLVQ